MKEGYLYAAYGSGYVEEAVCSLRSLKKVHPEAHVTLITNEKTDSTLGFDEVKLMAIPDDRSLKNEFGYLKKGFSFKIEALMSTPYNKTFFVDTDTCFADSCEELFDLLEYYDFLISHGTTDLSVVNSPTGKLNGYYPYNTGVICFRKSSNISTLLKEWLKAYENSVDYPHDQPALMEALLKTSSVKLYVLPSLYNFRFQFFVGLTGKVKLLHGRHNKIDEIITTVNSTEKHRMWDYQRGKIIGFRTIGIKSRAIELLPNSIYKAYQELKSWLNNLK